MKTFGEKLQQIQDAIEDILQNGQSHKIDGKEYTKANLRELYELEKHYLDLVLKYGRDKDPATVQNKRVAKVSFV